MFFIVWFYSMSIRTYKSTTNYFYNGFVLFFCESNCLLIHSITTLNFVFCMGFIAYFRQILSSLFTNPMNKGFFVFPNKIRNKLFVNISRRNFPHSVLKQYFLYLLHDICLQWCIQRIFMSYTVYFLNPCIIQCICAVI